MGGHQLLKKLRRLSATACAAFLALSTGVEAASLAIDGGRWFDGERFHPDRWFVVDGKLTRKQPARIDARINASGSFIVPPYADAHNHDMQNAWGVNRKLTANLKEGVFYSAQMCANDDIAPFRALFNRPNTPDVVAATACISASDGHPLGLLLQSGSETEGAKPDLIALRKYYVAVDTEAELAQRWPEVLEGKPDLVKIILIDSANHASRFGRPDLLGVNGLNPKLVASVVERAHAAGIRVAAHVDTAADVAVAASSGVDILAHLPGYSFEKHLRAADYRIDDATIAELARRKTVLIATASVSSTMIGLKGSELEEVQAVQKDNLARMMAAGVPLLIGSDNPFGGPVDEVVYLDKLGVLSRAKLLRSLTMDTPRVLFPRRKIGGFAEGAEASLLLLDADPLVDLNALRRIRLVLKQGQVLSLP